MAVGNYSSTLCAELNRLANAGVYPARSAFLDEQGAANKWAGTTGKSLVAALNIKNGVTNPSLFKNLGAVCNALASTTGKSPLAALTSISGDTPSYLALGASISPFIWAASFSKSSGISSLFANPASLPAQQVYPVEFNSDASRLAYGDNSPGTSVTNYAFSSSGFGSKSAAATVNTGERTTSFMVFDSTMNNAKTLSLWGMDNNVVAVIPFTASGFATGLRYQAPNAATTYSIAMNASDSALFSCGSSDFGARAWSNSTYGGTTFTAPAGIGGAAAFFGIRVNPAENVVAVASQNLKNIYAYAWSNSTGWGTKYTDTVSNSASLGRGVLFSPDSSYLWSFTDAGTFRFPFSSGSGFGTRTSGGFTSGVSYARFNAAGDTVAATGYSRGFELYPWDGTTLGTMYTKPTFATTGHQKLAFHG